MSINNHKLKTPRSSSFKEKYYELREEFFEKIYPVLDLYWTILPYDYRPGNIWYKFACWAWRRHTTVKPRTLPHTWCDRSDVLPHMMMEILTQFVEKECSPGYVEWYGEGSHKITHNGHEWNVRDMMQHIIDWWSQVYLKKDTDARWEFMAAHTVEKDNIVKNILCHDPKDWDSEENFNKWELMTKRSRKKMEKMEEALDENLVLIIKMRHSLWT
jgi:hypothetical protein